MTGFSFTENISLEKIQEAYKRISPFLPPTPVQTSTYINSLTDNKQIFFKCENFQKTGAFKARGALNAVLKKVVENPNSPYKGCVTHSSGNHGQAVAWACHVNKIPCSIVLPINTPIVKIDAVKTYKADVILCENSPVSRVETCSQISKEKNYVIINPYDDYDVMCGQGTVALELIDQIPELDAILVSVSGGGLISGISVYAKSIKPGIKIFAVEPEGKRLTECLKKNERNLDSKPTAYLDTLAEGIRTEQCGVLTFPVVREFVDDVFTVSDVEMVEATKLVFKRMKLVIELSAGAAVAAVLSDKMKTEYPGLKNIGIILCGGNIDIDLLPW